MSGGRNPGNRKCILVVEDEEACRLLIEAHLARFPVEVHHCADAESALDQLERLRPDLVLMDLVLPGIGGIPAIERIRCCEGYEETPIVVVTNMNDAASSIQARNSGATSYMVKPVTADAVASVLQRFLGIRPAAQPRDPGA